MSGDRMRMRIHNTAQRVTLSFTAEGGNTRTEISVDPGMFSLALAKSTVGGIEIEVEAKDFVSGEPVA